MKAYTNLKWIAAPLHETEEDKAYIYAEGLDQTIAVAYKINSMTEEEAEANAKVMAASKDLLEALQEFMFLSNPKNGDTLQAQKAIHELQTNYPAIWKKLEQAQGAINKAIQ